MKNYEITFSPKFLKTIKKLKPNLQAEVIHRVEMLKEEKNHQALRVHKLKGKLKDRYSFSVDHKNRIIFNYIEVDTIYLLNFGGHEIYDL